MQRSAWRLRQIRTKLSAFRQVPDKQRMDTAGQIENSKPRKIGKSTIHQCGQHLLNKLQHTFKLQIPHLSRPWHAFTRARIQSKDNVFADGFAQGIRIIGIPKNPKMIHGLKFQFDLRQTSGIVEPGAHEAILQ